MQIAVRASGALHRHRPGPGGSANTPKSAHQIGQPRHGSKLGRAPHCRLRLPWPGRRRNRPRSSPVRSRASARSAPGQASSTRCICTPAAREEWADFAVHCRPCLGRAAQSRTPAHCKRGAKRPRGESRRDLIAMLLRVSRVSRAVGWGWATTRVTHLLGACFYTRFKRATSSRPKHF